MPGVLRPGDRLPDLPLAAPDGEAASLARLGNEHLLLVFLRHLT